MYVCPNCAGNLKFSIERQQLFCEHCHMEMDPYDYKTEQDAEETEYCEVTVFTCPQCGGEILSDDNTAATFCSYCGGATILDSRLSRMRKPQHIIPFEKTAEDCRAAYMKVVQGVSFVPDELKDAESIKKFRGIYMPYWIYSFQNEQQIQFRGSHTRKMNDGRVAKDIMDLVCHVEAEYEGIAFDASTNFSDQLSGSIAPFHFQESKPFTPSFLSGFYADINDVEPSRYYEAARDIVVEDEFDKLKKDPYLQGCEIESRENSSVLKMALKPRKVKEELAFFPVWFLSYQKDDRVAYGVVNGQTGKVFVDLPIDMKKFFFGSMLLTLPLFILLELFCMIPGKILLSISMILATLCTIFVHDQTTHVMMKESYDNTRLATVEGIRIRKRNRMISETVMTVLTLATSIGSSVFLIMELFMHWGGQILAVAELVYLIYLTLDVIWKRKVKDIYNTKLEEYEIQWQNKVRIMVKPMVATLFSSLMLLLNLPYGIIYYLCAFVCLAMIVWIVVDMIKSHNILVTRPLPQFNKRGGDQ